MADRLSRQNHKEDKDEEIEGSEHKQHRNIHKHSRMYGDTWIAALSRSRQSFTTTERMHHKRMAREQRQFSTEPQALLDNLRWHGSNWLGHPKRQMYSDT